MEVDHQNIPEVFPHMHGVLSELSAMYQPYVKKLFDDDVNVVIEGLKEIKNFVIGNNKQKTNFIVLGTVPRLVYLIQQESSDASLKNHCAVILGSLAKGMDANVKSLLDYGVLDVMLYGLRQSDLRFYEACLRCVRTIVIAPGNQDLIFVDVSIIPVLLDSINRSMCTQEATCEILIHCCNNKERQDLLYDLKAVQAVSYLLLSSVNRVIIKALLAISVLCHKNLYVCRSIATVEISNERIVDILSRMLSRSQPTQTQVNAAKCLAYVHRSGIEDGLDKQLINKKVLPCLIHMCHSSHDIDERVVGAKTVAYLIEADPELQRLAITCEQFTDLLSEFFRYPTVVDAKNIADMRRFKHELGRENDLYEAVFLAYAALLADDEDIRHDVASDVVVDRLVKGLASSNENVRVAALQGLLSLSRSIQVVRTIFEDHEVWKPVLKIVQDQTGNVSERERVAASAVMCNLLLEFSPCKPKLLAGNLLHLLKSWCESNSCINLKRNGIWGFLNVTFQTDLELKTEVMKLLCPETLFILLTSTDYDVVVKTLGVLNNVLSTAEHADAIMTVHGDAIMQACAIAIESTSLPIPSSWSGIKGRSVACAVHTHALCVLGCVAAADNNKTLGKYLHDNDNFFKKLVCFLGQPDVELQTAAVVCVCSLCTGDDPNAAERREKFKKFGLIEALQNILAVDDATKTILQDRATTISSLLQPTPDMQ